MGVFSSFDTIIQTPFTDGVSSTVSAAMSAIQGPLTSVVVLWVIISGIQTMRGDISARTGITRIVNVSLVVGILMSTTLYNEYIVDFFTAGLPDYIASSLTGVQGTTASASTFDTVWVNALQVFNVIDKGLNFWNVLYCVQLGMLQLLIAIPISIVFLIYETTRIMIDIVVCIGPFILPGYLFTATKSVADRYIGKLISLSILTLLVNIVLTIIVNGYTTYIATTLGQVTSNSDKAYDITIADQMLLFFAVGSLITTFLPGLAAFLGGGISVSPMQMATAAMNATRMLPSGGKK